MRRHGTSASEAVRAVRGTGQETRSETVTVRIPPGVADGDRLRVPAKGNVGVGGGPAGDLYVTVKVGAHPVFRRDNDDLHMSVPDRRARSGAGSARGDSNARRRGAPADSARNPDRPAFSSAGTRGAVDDQRATRDLIVEVRIMLPKLLDERSKELLREFGRINVEPVRE